MVVNLLQVFKLYILYIILTIEDNLIQRGWQEISGLKQMMQAHYLCYSMV